MLVADAASLTLIVAEAASVSDSSRRGAVTLGGLGYVFAPAIIHVAHDRGRMAPASIGVRVSVPVAGLVVGAVAGGCQGGGESGDFLCPGAVPGLVVGLVVASALDAGLFSWGNPQSEARTKPELGFTPVLSPDGKRAELRAYGTF